LSDGSEEEVPGRKDAGRKEELPRSKGGKGTCFARIRKKGGRFTRGATDIGKKKSLITGKLPMALQTTRENEEKGGKGTFFAGKSVYDH